MSIVYNPQVPMLRSWTNGSTELLGTFTLRGSTITKSVNHPPAALLDKEVPSVQSYVKSTLFVN